MSGRDFGFGLPLRSATRPETGLVGRGHFRVDAGCPFPCDRRRGREVAHIVLTCGYIRSLWTEKQKLGPTLVFWFPRGPQVPMGWLDAQKRPLSSMKCQKHSATRHETPLARRSRATTITRPNRFARCFGHVLDGSGGPLGSNCPRERRLVIEMRLIWVRPAAPY